MLKQPTTYSQQIAKLREHGCTVVDEASCEEILSRVGYYRLSAYLLTLEQMITQSDGKRNILRLAQTGFMPCWCLSRKGMVFDMNNQDVRWIQRFENFTKAYTLLRSALEDKEIDAFDDLQKEGLIQRFEYTFELLWKTLKDFLENEKVNIDIISPKNVFKAAASSNLLEMMDVDGELLLDMHEKRNLMSHTYDIAKFKETLVILKKVYLPEIDKIYDYLLVKRLSYA